MVKDEVIKTEDENASTEINPFFHRPNWSCYQILKIFFNTFTIFPLRLFSVSLIFSLLYPSVCIAYWFGSSRKVTFDRTRNLSETTLLLQSRPLTGKTYNFLVKWLNMLDRALLWVCGFYKIKVIGQPCKKARILVCAPHSTFADSAVVMYPEIKSIVAKKAAGSIPVLGTLVSFLQPIWVERDQSKSRRTAIQGIVKRVKEDTANEWPQICIFPEGTCTNTKCLISFKKGAFYPGVPVQPVCIRYPNKFDCLTWTWDGPNTFFVIWWCLCQFSLKIQIEYLPVYYPDERERNDPELYAENVRTVMAEHLQVPKVNLTYEDCKELLVSSTTQKPFSISIFNEILQKIYVINKPSVSCPTISSLPSTSKFGSGQTSNGNVSKDTLKYKNIPSPKQNIENFKQYILAACCKSNKPSDSPGGNGLEPLIDEITKLVRTRDDQMSDYVDQAKLRHFLEWPQKYCIDKTNQDYDSLFGAAYKKLEKLIPNYKDILDKYLSDLQVENNSMLSNANLHIKLD